MRISALRQHCVLVVIWATLGIAIISMVGNCGGNGPSTLTMGTAWKLFEAGDYARAADLFGAIVEEDPKSAAGFEGLGWSLARLGDYDSATLCMYLSLEYGSNTLSTRAALSALQKASGYYQSAVYYSQYVLEHDADWVFAHDRSIDFRDLLVISAQANFAMGPSRYADAQAAVDRLMPQNGLNPHDLHSWNGQPSYAAALLELIEDLGRQYGKGVL
jgi:tetratricopeptide (TPR) repeat protein